METTKKIDSYINFLATQVFFEIYKKNTYNELAKIEIEAQKCIYDYIERNSDRLNFNDENIIEIVARDYLQGFYSLYNKQVNSINYYWIVLSATLPKRPTKADFCRREWAEKAREMLGFPYSYISNLTEVNYDVVSSNDDLKKMYCDLQLHR